MWLEYQARVSHGPISTLQHVLGEELRTEVHAFGLQGATVAATFDLFLEVQHP
jgi:hypothetical protein